MEQHLDHNHPEKMAAEIDAAIRSVSFRNIPNVRAVRRKYSKMLKDTSPEFMLEVARILFKQYSYRWFSYELIQGHQATFERIGEAELEEFGQGIDSWWTVDAFTRTLSGPAWLRGQVSDDVIRRFPLLWPFIF